MDKISDDRTFLAYIVRALLYSPSLKGFFKKDLRRTKKMINTVSKTFNVCGNDYNLAKNTAFLAKSIFSSSSILVCL